MKTKSSDEAREELLETFEQNSSELYWLAYLLTGNEDRSVQAFSSALEAGEESNAVFDGFMNEWARKLVIVEALATIETELRRSIARTARLAGADIPRVATWTRRLGIAKEDFEEAVSWLDAFPRCAMLLTIFEGMSIAAAATLLHADEALTAAAQRIGVVQLTRHLTGSPGREFFAGRFPVPVLSLS